MPGDTNSTGSAPLNVLIIGAGQSGLAAAWALKRKKIDRIRLVDSQPESFEGPWDTYARMDTLRTPKHVTALDSGVASLTFRAWYDASGLRPVWAEIDRAPRTVWMDYLRWFRRVLALPVQNETRLVGFAPAGNDLLDVELSSNGETEIVQTRKLVLATGMNGGGEYAIPLAFAAGLPPQSYAHAYDEIDFENLIGKRIAILGIGSAAADNATAALKAGAARVDLFARRPPPPSLEARDWVEHAGFLHGFTDLPDTLRWEVAHKLIGISSPAPPWSMEKCSAFPNCSFHFEAGWQTANWTGSEIRIETVKGSYVADFVIFATGATVDLGRRPELTAHRSEITLWRDRFEPAAEKRCEATLDFPYLSSGFAIIPRHADNAAYLKNVHLFNRSATASLGVGAATVTGLGFASDRLASALTSDLYRSVAEDHVAEMPWPHFSPAPVVFNPSPMAEALSAEEKSHA